MQGYLLPQGLLAPRMVGCFTDDLHQVFTKIYPFFL